MSALASTVGMLLVALTLVDAFEVMLLPRRVRRRLRFVRAYFRATWRVWTLASRGMPERTRGTFLSVYGPLSMLRLFAAWIAAIVTGCGLLPSNLGPISAAQPRATTSASKRAWPASSRARCARTRATPRSAR